jgi:hypothetical protein
MLTQLTKGKWAVENSTDDPAYRYYTWSNGQYRVEIWSDDNTVFIDKWDTSAEYVGYDRGLWKAMYSDIDKAVATRLITTALADESPMDTILPLLVTAELEG